MESIYDNSPIKELSIDDFKKSGDDVLLNSDIIKSPALLKFYAPWCPHCHTIKPLLEKFMKQSGINVGAINCDSEKNIQSILPITGFPTLYYVDNSNKLTKYEGNRSLEDLEDIFKSIKTIKPKNSKIGIVNHLLVNGKTIKRYNYIVVVKKYKENHHYFFNNKLSNDINMNLGEQLLFNQIDSTNFDKDNHAINIKNSKNKNSKNLRYIIDAKEVALEIYSTSKPKWSRDAIFYPTNKGIYHLECSSKLDKMKLTITVN